MKTLRLTLDRMKQDLILRFILFESAFTISFYFLRDVNVNNLTRFSQLQHFEYLVTLRRKLLEFLQKSQFVSNMQI